MSWIENKRIVITGPTSGIGREIAFRLALLGANVVLACRNPQVGEQIAADINTTTSRGCAVVMKVDMADQRSIRTFASHYRDKFGALNVLVNNAGVLLPRRQLSIDDIELTFATNVLGYYLTTAELLESLHAGAPARIVNVASTFASDLDLDDLQFRRRSYDGMAAYAQSKACNRMLTWALARRLIEASITVNAMAPGLVLGTELYRYVTPQAKRTLERLGSRSVSTGADTAVWLASSFDLNGITNRFFEQRQEIPCQFRHQDNEEHLWRACKQLTLSAPLQFTNHCHPR
jgi:NAD(P)-dependent dehydrogenase (short-subunit alcohol dehydrogenase family)